MPSTSLLFAVLLLVCQVSAVAAEPDTSSWTHLESQMGDSWFRISVPGQATLKPYISLEDSSLYESNPGSLLFDLYWEYGGFRKKYGGVRATLSIWRFQSPISRHGDYHKNLSEAVEESRRIGHENQEDRFAANNPRHVRSTFESVKQYNEHYVNGTLWVEYALMDVVDAGRNIHYQYYAATLDSEHYVRVAFTIDEYIKFKSKRTDWYPKAEALVKTIADSLKISTASEGKASPEEPSISQPTGRTQPPGTKAETRARRNGSLKGTISGDIYTFPGSLFNCTVPPLIGERRVSDFVSDDGGSVTFSNDLNIIRIDCVRFSEKEQEEFREADTKVALCKDFFEATILPAVMEGVPDAELQFGGVVLVGDDTIGREELFLAYMRLPHQGGGISWDNGKEIKSDAFRGWLVYASDGYFYSVSHQLQTDLNTDRWMQELTAVFQRCSFGRWWERK